jgi:hypothetical protein
MVEQRPFEAPEATRTATHGDAGSSTTILFAKPSAACSNELLAATAGQGGDSRSERQQDPHEFRAVLAVSRKRRVTNENCSPVRQPTR